MENILIQIKIIPRSRFTPRLTRVLLPPPHPLSPSPPPAPHLQADVKLLEGSALSVMNVLGGRMGGEPASLGPCELYLRMFEGNKRRSGSGDRGSRRVTRAGEEYLFDGTAPFWILKWCCVYCVGAADFIKQKHIPYIAVKIRDGCGSKVYFCQRRRRYLFTLAWARKK